MKQSYKLSLIVFISTLTILGVFIWMPNLAGPDGLEKSLFDITGNDNFEPNSEFDYVKKMYPQINFKCYDGIHNRINSVELVKKFKEMGVKKQYSYEKTTPDLVWKFNKKLCLTLYR